MSSRCQQVVRPIVRSLRQGSHQPQSITAIRHFSSTTPRKDENSTTVQQPGTADASSNPVLDAALLGGQKAEATEDGSSTQWDQFTAAALRPELGSRRRRAALVTTGDVPFEQMPYQCFQEARKILAQDREEKIAKIVAEVEKIKRIEAQDASTFRGGEAYKQKRIESIRKEIEELKILADINDPLVKRRFEDGMGDMNKPIYRYLAERRWRSMDYKIIKQRIDQFHIVPDILPKFDPTVDVKMSFRSYKIKPGALLDSRMTEGPPTLRIQAFDKGERLLSIVVIDSDVPDVDSDAYTRRCHFMAANIPWDPTQNLLQLRHIGRGDGRTEGTLAVPWLPPHAQKGSPYHRLSIFILEQKPGQKIDETKLKELYGNREDFSLKGFAYKFGLEPVGFNLFRTVWDDNTAAVMERHSIPGADVEFKRQRVESLKPPRAARGWEAKRQKAKYKSIWKYTKRIKGYN
ncbi:phosphatidylethanolamine-binding protein [Apodospora peruviana]|uniref:Large ribosomal subunit protein mL38 n=1 Tax=Apodospora peruviana TaxID=516989 RepID=A0AAE0IJY0_9PEZI|nr:phosphatidylethanolamine-binding protein [Apodospora peruviana]